MPVNECVDYTYPVLIVFKLISALSFILKDFI